MAVEIRDAGPRVTPGDLDAFEASLGRRIPSPYRHFLMESNGGKPKPSEFQYQTPDGRYSEGMVRGFFGVHEGEHYNLRRYVKLYRERIPPDMFPIANDPGGNLMLMGTSGPREGKIYFWNHELEADDGSPAREDNVSFVANSIEDFLASLVDLPLPATK